MSYTEAKEKYAALGVDTETAIAKLKTVPLSLHCWQGDDVRGFDTDPTKPLTGGIQTTGSYPGRARTPQELMADIEEVLKLCPGTKKLNLHASYAIFDDGEWVDRNKLEPKHFALWVEFCKKHGIGVESCTVGNAEFSLSYAAMKRDKCISLMDNGHYHPTEVVSDKIPALLTFFPEIALHITRPVRWDSDHVVLFDDETKEICKEIVRCGGLDGRVHMALDYFDASVNRIAAWVTGFRNVQKALLNALLTPDMTKEQNEGDFTDLLVRQEELKTLPFGEVWAEYCRRCGVPEDGAWLPEVRRYEKTVLEARA